MSNSPLVQYTCISPNKTTPRNHAIDTITIHCVVGHLSVETLGKVFVSPTRQASSNYGIGPDGRIGMYVEEKDRSWCTSSASNDNRAITIEVASDTTSPYAVKDAAYEALIKLVVDICQRNGIKKLLWKGDKSLIGQVDKQNMTVHRWFANKSCPGDYLYNRHPDIAEKVNKVLAGTQVEKPQPQTPKTNMTYVGKGIGSAIAKTDMTVRDSGSISGNAIGTVFKGKAVEVLEITPNGWYKIVWPGSVEKGFGFTSNVDNVYYVYTPYKQSTDSSTNVPTLKFKVNDLVQFGGGKQYASSTTTVGATVKASRARVTKISAKALHPYHIRSVNSSGDFVAGVFGWVDESTLSIGSTRKTDEEIAREVIQGKWGKGADRKKRLEAAGYNYTTIQAIVNRLLG